MIHAIDLLGKEGVGSMGIQILITHLRSSGYNIERITVGANETEAQGTLGLGLGLSQPVEFAAKPDAIFVSAITPRSWVNFPQAMSRYGLALRASERAPSDPIVAFGGQSMLAPSPILEAADVIALGDGEATGPILAELIASHASKTSILDTLRGRQGFSVYPHEPLKLARLEAPLKHVSVLRPSPRSAATIEAARGCASKCLFCPIGWAGGKYREADKEQVKAAISKLSGVPINLYAPDYSAISWVEEADEALSDAGCMAKGRDARPDVTLRRLLSGSEPRGSKSYSFGIEGMSQRVRSAIGKHISDDEVVALMARLQQDGNKNVKWYMIFGFPGEREEDYAGFLSLIDRCLEVYSGHLSITSTLLQPTPHTPLQWIDGAYPVAAAAMATQLRADLGERYKQTGRRVIASQPKGKELHEHDVFVARGDREVFSYLEALNGRESWIQSGKWRTLASQESINRSLAPIEVGASVPWSGVDPGMAPSAVESAWKTYRQRMELQA